MSAVAMLGKYLALMNENIRLRIQLGQKPKAWSPTSQTVVESCAKGWNGFLYYAELVLERADVQNTAELRQALQLMRHSLGRPDHMAIKFVDGQAVQMRSRTVNMMEDLRNYAEMMRRSQDHRGVWQVSVQCAYDVYYDCRCCEAVASEFVERIVSSEQDALGDNPNLGCENFYQFLTENPSQRLERKIDLVKQDLVYLTERLEEQLPTLTIAEELSAKKWDRQIEDRFRSECQQKQEYLEYLQEQQSALDRPVALEEQSWNSFSTGGRSRSPASQPSSESSDSGLPSSDDDLEEGVKKPPSQRASLLREGAHPVHRGSEVNLLKMPDPAA